MDKQTANRGQQAAFLAEFAKAPIILTAAQAAGVTREVVWIGPAWYKKRVG